jgi:hypothetical protein
MMSSMAGQLGQSQDMYNNLSNLGQYNLGQGNYNNNQAGNMFAGQDQYGTNQAYRSDVMGNQASQGYHSALDRSNLAQQQSGGYGNQAQQGYELAQNQGQNQVRAGNQQLGQAKQGYELAQNQGQNQLQTGNQLANRAGKTYGDMAGVDPQAIAAAQLAGQNLQPYMNPYQKNVIDATMGEMGRQEKIQRNNIAAEAQAQNAFGGDRQAIENAENNRNFDQQRSQTLASLNQQNFGQAQSAAQTDNAAKMQAALANQQMQIGQQAGGASGLSNLGQSGQQLGMANQQFGTSGYQNLGQNAQQLGTANQQFGTSGYQGLNQGAQQNAQNYLGMGTSGLAGLSGQAGQLGQGYKQGASQGLAGLGAQQGNLGAQLGSAGAGGFSNNAQFLGNMGQNNANAGLGGLQSGANQGFGFGNQLQQNQLQAGQMQQDQQQQLIDMAKQAFGQTVGAPKTGLDVLMQSLTGSHNPTTSISKSKTSNGIGGILGGIGSMVGGK